MSVSWDALEEAIKTNPNRRTRLTFGTASASVATLPSSAKLVWFPGWTEDTTFIISDAVSFALWIRDPLYRTATHSVRRTMEMEEASWLLHSSETGWKMHNGKARGWIRKHLEEDLRARAGGGDPAPDAWEVIRTQKRAAQLIDYICVMRSLRIALWWPEQKSVTVVPASMGVPSSVPIVQLNCTSGHILLGQHGFHVKSCDWPAVLATTDFSWAPPLSAPSIGSQTVAQIQEQLDAVAPGAPRTGGRVGMWNRFLWHQLLNALKEQTEETVTMGILAKVTRDVTAV